MNLHRKDFPFYLSVIVYPLILQNAFSPVKSQFCANTCPPLAQNGEPVPSLCVGDIPAPSLTSKTYTDCNPAEGSSLPTTFSIDDFAGKGQIIVLANYYIGCNAGRRESGVFAHVGQRYFDEYGDKVIFINSLKGGASCESWADIYQNDASELYPESNVVPLEMPITVNDVNFEIRDDFFTTPFGHPSYVILNENLEVKNKFIGPCCGYESYSDCTAEIAKGLDAQLSSAIDSILEQQIGSQSNMNESVDQTEIESENLETVKEQNLADSGSEIEGEILPVINNSNQTKIESCEHMEVSQWSPCSHVCGPEKGIRFRTKAIKKRTHQMFCPDIVETQECISEKDICVSHEIEQFCVPEFGESLSMEQIASDFNSPTDIAFHPTPGYHLQDYSEGRVFHPNMGDEAWVLNGGNHSVSIVAALGTDEQTTISRRDRGYYHYMIEATALSFNKISDSGRAADRDSFNYWAVCNDNLNNYLGTKEPNYFMGPTLYNSDPKSRNLVNRLGEECGKEEPCFFLHSDMLHEAPACIGIVHDPETVTAFGNVYWAFDSTGNNENGQLVRFDFQQPHGPGSMDHSVASVRRYPEVKLSRGGDGVHAGMVVHEERRELYISNPGEGTILMVKPDSGTFARTAREEYPIFSNALPSFEYSIWECVDQKVFAAGVDKPSGLALSSDGERLFVAEHESGKIHAYEVSSGVLLKTIETGYKSIGGMDVSPTSDELYFVDRETNGLYVISLETECTTSYESRTSADFVEAMEKATEELESVVGPDSFSLIRDYQCKVDPIVPDASFFEQVHSDSGYASNDTDVQSEAGMDESAALLANRTDCGYDSELNFDALLLGGYFCHVCLPDGMGAECDMGGKCENVQWEGYLCDNEYIVWLDEESNELMIERGNGDVVEAGDIVLEYDVTYRFTVKSEVEVTVYGSGDFDEAMSLEGNECGCASMGPLMVTLGDEAGESIYLRSATGAFVELLTNHHNNPMSEDINTAQDFFTAQDSSPGSRSYTFFSWLETLLYICSLFLTQML